MIAVPAVLAAGESPTSIVRWLPQEIWERTDPDVLTALGEKIARLSARLNADSYRLLTLIAEFDRLEGWKREGCASCASWLAYRTRLDKMTAREKVRVAKALAQLPKTSEAMARASSRSARCARSRAPQTLTPSCSSMRAR